MNLDKLSLGEKILGASGLALFLLSFVGMWAKVEAEVGAVEQTARLNAWDGYGILLKLGLLLALIAAGLVIARAANANLDIPWANAYRGISIAALVLVGVTFLIGPDESGSFSNEFGRYEISRGIALFIGTLLAAVMAAGAWLHSEGASASPGTATA